MGITVDQNVEMQQQEQEYSYRPRYRLQAESQVQLHTSVTALYHRYTRLSLSTIVLNSEDRQGMYAMQHFHTPRNPPYNRL